MEKITHFLIIFKEAITPLAKWIDRHNGFVTAVATGIIAIFTLALVCANRKMWKISRRQTAELKRSVDSLENTEQANLFVTVQHPEDISHVKSFCEFTVINVGRTPAILTSINGSYEKIAHRDSIPNISPEGDHGIVPDTIIIGIGTEGSKPFMAKKAQAFNIDNRLICIGRIQYKDIFGKSHETGFCWEYLHSIDEFSPINDPKYNYRT